MRANPSLCVLAILFCGLPAFSQTTRPSTQPSVSTLNELLNERLAAYPEYQAAKQAADDAQAGVDAARATEQADALMGALGKKSAAQLELNHVVQNIAGRDFDVSPLLVAIDLKTENARLKAELFYASKSVEQRPAPEPTIPADDTTGSTSGSGDSETYVGPRGGVYHYSANGNKVYEKH